MRPHLEHFNADHEHFCAKNTIKQWNGIEHFKSFEAILNSKKLLFDLFILIKNPPEWCQSNNCLEMNDFFEEKSY